MTAERNAASSSRDRFRAALHESLVLPFLFLTVAAVGGFRLTSTGEARFLPPSLFHLILAALLLGALIQGRLLRPAALTIDRAAILDSVAGVMLIATLFAATAQLFNGLLPEEGALALVFNLFFALILSNMMAAPPDRSRLLRSISVLFGWALVIKYVLFSALETQEPTLAERLLRALLRGGSLGTLPAGSWHPAVGYVMFAAVVLYLLGLWLVSRTAGQPMTPAGAGDAV